MLGNMLLRAAFDVAVPREAVFGYYSDPERMLDFPASAVIHTKDSGGAGMSFRVEMPKRDRDVKGEVEYEAPSRITIRAWPVRRPDCVTTSAVEFHAVDGKTRVARAVDLPLSFVASAVMWLMLPVYRVHVRRKGRKAAAQIEDEHRRGRL